MDTKKRNSSWKGEAAAYSTKHTMMNYDYGKPSLCEDCGTTNAKKFEWANISGEYLRKREDWKRLCKKCHYKMDADHYIKNKALGDKHGKSKLNSFQVQRMRLMYEVMPKKNYSLIGRLFKTTKQNAYAVINNITWKHV